MTRTPADYPLAETQPHTIHARSGKPMADITLEAVLAGAVTLDDLRVSAGALRAQGEIARAAGRPTLAQNFERAADLVAVPQDVLMAAYDLLRPGRARSRADLDALAARLRRDYGADTIAKFIEEAAEVYDQRGLFLTRY